MRTGGGTPPSRRTRRLAPHCPKPAPRGDHAAGSAAARHRAKAWPRRYDRTAPTRRAPSAGSGSCEAPDIPSLLLPSGRQHRTAWPAAAFHAAAKPARRKTPRCARWRKIMGIADTIENQQKRHLRRPDEIDDVDPPGFRDRDQSAVVRGYRQPVPVPPRPTCDRGGAASPSRRRMALPVRAALRHSKGVSPHPAAARTRRLTALMPQMRSSFMNVLPSRGPPCQRAGVRRSSFRTPVSSCSISRRVWRSIPVPVADPA